MATLLNHFDGSAHRMAPENLVLVQNSCSQHSKFVISSCAQRGRGNDVLNSYDIEKSYPLDCGSHAVNTPGSGLLDFKVHVASSQDTQSALISNVELDVGAPLATSKEHTLAKTNAGSFMAGIRGLWRA